MGLFDGGVTEFQIRNLNVKEGGYESGDSITGEVVLVATREIKCREFVAVMEGSANTEWARTSYNHCGYSDASDSHTELYIGFERITEDCKMFNGQGIITPGKYFHKFAFRLPSKCPPSFQGVHGHISYVIKAKIDRPMAIDNEVSTAIPVRGALDLNTLPPCVREPVENQGMEELGACCCKNGRIRIHGRIPKGAYALGENVEIKMEVDNFTKKPVVMIMANIVENATFTGYIGGVWGGGGHMERVNGSKPVVCATKQVNILPQTQQAIDFVFQIPKNIPQRIECSIITTQHALELCAMFSDKDRASACILPFDIGTIPLS